MHKMVVQHQRLLNLCFANFGVELRLSHIHTYQLAEHTTVTTRIFSVTNALTLSCNSLIQ